MSDLKRWPPESEQRSQRLLEGFGDGVYDVTRLETEVLRLWERLALLEAVRVAIIAQHELQAEGQGGEEGPNAWGIRVAEMDNRVFNALAACEEGDGE